MLKRLRGLLFAIGAALLSTAGASADRSLEVWKSRLSVIERQLAAQAWSSAEDAARRLTGEMIDKLTYGKTGGDWLGLAYAFRGIAEVGLGREEEGLWHWRMGEQLSSLPAKLNLAAYGTAGTFLMAAPRQSCDDLPAFESPDATEAGASVGTPEIQPPRATLTKSPPYPAGLRAEDWEGKVRVRALVGPDGLPREPALEGLRSEMTAMTAAVLDTLRLWRFEPARRAGQPVEFCFTWTVSFKLMEDPP